MGDKRPPIFLAPDYGMVGDKTLVICHGPDTYQIDLEAFFKTVPMAALHSKYLFWCHEQDPNVQKRLDEMRLKDGE